MLAPKLRFKEFNDEWNYKLFNEIFEFIQNNSFSRDMLNYSENSKIYNIHYGDILTKYGEIIDFNIISNIIPKINNDISLSKFEDKSYLKNGDIIIADTAEDLTVGKSCEVVNLHCKALAGLHTIPCRPKFKFASQYLGEYINSTSYHSQLIPYITGIKVSSISKTSIIKTKIYFPTIKEQEKISKLFSLLNKKIELQQRKIEVLKMYKKGLFQKILNYEGEKRKISEILEEVVEKSTENNQYDVISSTKEGLILQKEYFNRNIASENNIGYKILRNNQIVLSPQNLWMGNINYNDKYCIGIVSPSYKIFDIKEGYSKEYIASLLKTNRALYMYKISSEQGASIVRRNLNMDAFYEITFKIPSLKEQIKYGEIIKKLNRKIDNMRDTLNMLLKIKKGLLQQMFI